MDGYLSTITDSHPRSSSGFRYSLNYPTQAVQMLLPSSSHSGRQYTSIMSTLGPTIKGIHSGASPSCRAFVLQSSAKLSQHLEDFQPQFITLHLPLCQSANYWHTVTSITTSFGIGTGMAIAPVLAHNKNFGSTTEPDS